jgi:hypothetical protein
MAGESVRARTKRQKTTTHRWDVGADGEGATAAALKALPSGWVVLSDLAWPGQQHVNIDHVVIGPAGVFVIDTMNWSGRVIVDDGTLRQSGRDRSTAVWGAVSAATSLSRMVPSVRADHVHAVVCQANGDSRVAWVDDVLVCSSALLVEEMTAFPEVLPGGLARAVSVDVGRRLRPVDEPTAVERAPKRRPFAALVPAVLAAALGVTLMSQPDVVTSLVDDVADSVVELMSFDGAE